MNNVVLVAAGSFFLIGLLLGWALGYQAARGEMKSSDVFFEEGGGI